MPGDRGYTGRRRLQDRPAGTGRPFTPPERRTVPTHRRPATRGGPARVLTRTALVTLLSALLAGTLLTLWPEGAVTVPAAAPQRQRGHLPDPHASDDTAAALPSPVALATRVVVLGSSAPATARPTAAADADVEAAPAPPDLSTLALAGLRGDPASPVPSTTPSLAPRPIEVLTPPGSSVGPVADIPVAVDPAQALRAACIVLDPASPAMPSVYPAFPVVPRQGGGYGCTVAFPGTPQPGHRYAVQAVLVSADDPLALAYGVARMGSLPASMIATASDPVEVVVG